MKFSSHLRTALPILLLGLTAGALRADIITLKSGEKLNDVKILEETPDSYRIEYKITAKIKDTKTIAKSDVQEIKKSTPSEVEFQEKGVGKILPTPDLMKASDYEAVLENKVRPFIAKYPGTPEAAEAQKIMATLSEEQNKARSGQIKVDGKWLDPVTARKDQYNIEAYSVRQEMKHLADEKNNENHYLNAMREFEKLRTQYRASLQYVDAIPEALKFLDGFEAQLNYLISAQPAKAADRAKGLKNLTGADATVTKSAIQKEETEFKMLHDAQTKAHVKWRNFYAYDLPSLKEALNTVQAERRELSAIDRDTLRQENEAYTTVIRYLAEGDVNDAAASLDRIARQAQSNPKPNNSNAALMQDLQKKLNALRAEEKRKASLKEKESVVSHPDSNASGTNENPLGPEIAKREAARKQKEEEARQARQRAAEERARVQAATAPPPAAEEGFLAKYGLYSGAGLLIVLVIGLYALKNRKKED